MCGIAGELLFTSPAGRKADWDSISALMARRGPDDSGIWTDDKGCTLVFRRLAIIDLSPMGHQPMTVGNGRFVLVFNGEVYNFQELRHELESRGVQFRSTSDSEVVLHALIEWGNKALERFNGMFALAFYDSVERRLLLARDHAGIKPLYYLIRPKGIVFASQYNQLLAHPLSHDLDISQEALGLYLRLAYVPAPYGILEDSYMLKPGTWIRCNAERKLQEGIFYQFPQYEMTRLKGRDAIDAVDAVTSAAVKRHMVSDVPVGTFLSGGVDSPLVVAKMRAAKSSVIEAFTIGTGEEATDETGDAGAFARELGVKHTIETMMPSQSLDFIDDVIDACGEPFGDYSMFPTMMVSRMASQKYKVMLSGDGGDELFWGYLSRFGPLVGRAEEFRTPLWYRWLGRAFQKFSRKRLSNPYLTHSSLGDWHRSMLTHLPEFWLKQVFPSLAAWPTDYTVFQNDNCESRRAAEQSRLTEFVGHLPYVLMKVDRASMYHSLEVRVPLLDREVIEVAAQIDWKECLDIPQGIGKIPLRRVLARYATHQTQVKRGFEVPMGTWLRTSLREMIEESLMKRDELLGLGIDKNGLRKLFALHLSGQGDFAWGLWPLLSLALWVDKHYHPLKAQSMEHL